MSLFAHVVAGIMRVQYPVRSNIPSANLRGFGSRFFVIFLARGQTCGREAVHVFPVGLSPSLNTFLDGAEPAELVRLCQDSTRFGNC